MIIVIIYLILGYWAFGVVNAGKVYVHTFGGLFLHRLIMGFILGWALIPMAIVKTISNRK